MTRFASVNELSPAGTNITGASTSNSVKTARAQDARIYMDLTAVPGGGQTMDVFVQTSPDNTDWFDVGAFNQFGPAVKKDIFTLSEEKMGSFVRLRYVPSGAGPFVLGARIEKKQGG